jgi:hypothetical protein
MAFAQHRLTDHAALGVGLVAHQPAQWRARWTVEKVYRADCPRTGRRAGTVLREEFEGNLLMNGGASVIWQRLKTNKPSTSSTGAALQAFSSGNARIGVGNSTATAAVTQTDLQGASKAYKGMESGYPSHTDGTSSSGARAISFQAKFSTAQANHAWNEWGLFNSTGASKRMLNRKVQALGTKTSAAQWTLTLTLSLS